jgi:hypothetical protein
LLATLRQRDRDLDEIRQRLDLLLGRLCGPRSECVAADQLLLLALVAKKFASFPAAGSGPWQGEN